jgi:hypothetical protein
MISKYEEGTGHGLHYNPGITTAHVDLEFFYKKNTHLHHQTFTPFNIFSLYTNILVPSY